MRYQRYKNKITLGRNAGSDKLWWHQSQPMKESEDTHIYEDIE